jgi:pSer/pThr/pTyr-binding forkhead associated (FHA) protein
MSGSAGQASLRVVRDHVVVTERALQERMTIGRAPDNDLVLDDERVSGHHGLLESVPGADGGEAQWRFTDVGSTNGSTLAGGSVLRAGQSVLLREDSQILLGDTVLDLRLQLGAAVAEEAGDERAEESPPGRPRLLVVVGGRSTTVPIRGRSAVIGRGAGCDVRIDDPSVSALQARLELADGRWLLTNLSATNPTRLGLRPVVGSEPVEDGAHLIAGAADLLFVLDDPLETPEARAQQDARVLELGLRRRRLAPAAARAAQAALSARGAGTAGDAGGMRLGEYLVGRGWLSPGAWVELRSEATAPATLRDTGRRTRIVVFVVLAAAALAGVLWRVVVALS